MRPRRWSRQRDALRKRRLAFDHYTCQACGLYDPSGKALAMDEILPLTLGGTETWENVGTLCHRCNGVKGMSTMSYAEVGEVVARLQRGGERAPTFFSQHIPVDQAQPEKYPRKRLIWR
jgi:hypothetical protein